jgi:glycosyltransferase involved in cell wall biosynthesis
MRWSYIAVERWLALRSDAIVSVSFSEYDAALGAGISLPTHRVIHNGLPAASTEGNAPIEINPQQLNLAFIGRFDRLKGIDILIRALEDPRLNETVLWLIGSGTSTGDEATIPARSNIHPLGWIPNRSLDSFIRCFDAIVIPSRAEAFGLVALEAMRNSKPVVASRVGGLRELVIDRVNGRLFEPDDVTGLRQVLLSLTKHELTRMGRIGRTIFESGFVWDRCFKAWNDVMNEAITNRAAHLELQSRSSLKRAWETLWRVCVSPG